MRSSADLPWLILDLEHDPNDSAWVEAVLERHGFEGWEIKRELPDALWRLYFPLEGNHTQRLSSLQADLEALGVIVKTSGEIRDEDWSENWKEFYHPFQVGERLIIAPSWEEPHEDLVENRLVLRIDPGSAFGTGYHESTRLCLAGLESLTQDPAWGKGCLLDYGTGSGILGIAALLLGCPKVVLADRDPVAVKVAGENARINGFSLDRYRTEQSDLPRKPSVEEGAGYEGEESYPFVVANLTADILCQLCGSLVAVAQKHILLGGIVDVRAARVVTAFEDRSCTLVAERREKDWVSYHFLAPSASLAPAFTH